jgi:hypothetical protein
MKKNMLLPYGSVVTIKGGTIKYEIIGLLVKNRKTRYDYCAIELPKGYLGKDTLIAFNHDNIDKVIFEGYSDDKIESYIEDVVWFKNRGDKNGK